MNKKIKYILVCIVILILIMAFFHQFNVSYSACYKIYGHEDFAPDAYILCDSKQVYYESPFYEYKHKELDSVMKGKFDFNKYSYVFVYGAKVKRMYYSVKTTLFDDVAPSYLKSYKLGKFTLFVEYEKPDSNMYIYQIDKNTMLRKVGLP